MQNSDQRLPDKGPVQIELTRGEIAICMAAVHVVADAAPLFEQREAMIRLYNRLEASLK